MKPVYSKEPAWHRLDSVRLDTYECPECTITGNDAIGRSHEEGCPNKWISAYSGKAYLRECCECGREFYPTHEVDETCDWCCNGGCSLL